MTSRGRGKPTQYSVLSTPMQLVSHKLFPPPIGNKQHKFHPEKHILEAMQTAFAMERT